jgi:hypothetical protein
VVLDIINGGLAVVLGQSPSMVVSEVATKTDKASFILKMKFFKQE